MENPQPSDQPPTVLLVLGWLIWVLEVAGFLFLAGCAVVLALGQNKPLAIVAVAVGLAIFGYAMALTFNQSKTGRPRLLAGCTLILAAAFVLFGGCTLGFQ
ncbi:MAG: hypothetical protein AAF358_03795 [Pseudomonadota bacterium]